MNEELTIDICFKYSIYRLRMQDLYQDVNMVKKKVYLMCSISRLTFHKVWHYPSKILPEANEIMQFG